MILGLKSVVNDKGEIKVVFTNSEAYKGKKIYISGSLINDTSIETDKGYYPEDVIKILKIEEVHVDKGEKSIIINFKKGGSWQKLMDALINYEKK